MAMTPTLWSISGLAIELALDRRTIAAKLRDVPPDGQLRGHPAWRLQTALLALRGDTKRPEPVPPPAGAAVLAQVRDPVHVGMVTAALSAIYALPWYAYFVARELDCDEETAAGMAAVAVLLAIHFEREFRALGIQAFKSGDVVWLEEGCFWWTPVRGLHPALKLPADAA